MRKITVSIPEDDMVACFYDFKDKAASIKRAGFANLIKFLRTKTNFFETNVSFRDKEGGLVEAALITAQELLHSCCCEYSDETLMVVSLFYLVGLVQDVKFLNGTGACSVYVIEQFMPLTPEEAAAIRYFEEPQKTECRLAKELYAAYMRTKYADVSLFDTQEAWVDEVLSGKNTLDTAA